MEANMSSLGPEARSMIDDADGSDAASAADKERVRARLAQQIGLAAAGVVVATKAGAVASATGVGAGAKATAAAASSGGAMLIAKIVTGLLAASIITTAAIVVKRRDTDATRELPPAPTMVVGVGASPVDPLVPRLPGVGVGSMTANEPGSVSTNEPGAVSANVHEPRSNEPRTVSVSAPPHAAPPAEGTKVVPTKTSWGASSVQIVNGEGEAALLRKAQVASDSGDGVTALAALDTHARLYPNGVLADQREGERVVAMCAMGQVPAAREAGARFVEAHPRASQADRIRRTCHLP
jgi:hypothetical protein